MVSDALVFRISRMGGGRQLLFFPYLVLKFGRGHQRQLLEREAGNANAAGRGPFWAELALRSVRLGPMGAASWRHGRVTLDDYDALAHLVERRLDAALAFPRQPIRRMLRGNVVLRHLGRARRLRAARLIGKAALPSTSMHGDFHMFNFCRSSAGKYLVLDWEHYDPNGSFVFDYLDFHIANRCWSQDLRWPAFLGAMDAGDPLVTGLAGRLGLSAEVLWFYYLATKIEITVLRKGGLEGAPEADRVELLRILEVQMDRLERTDLSRRPMIGWSLMPFLDPFYMLAAAI